MKRAYDASLRATVTLDEDGKIRAITYVDRLPEARHSKGRRAAEEYFREIAEKLSIPTRHLRNLDQLVSFTEPRERGIEYQFSEEKTFFDATTYAYYETYLNIPVWESGLTVTIKGDPAHVVGATNTTQDGIDGKMPSAEDIDRYLRLFATGEQRVPEAPRPEPKQTKARDNRGAQLLAEILAGLPGKAGTAGRVG